MAKAEKEHILLVGSSPLGETLRSQLLGRDCIVTTLPDIGYARASLDRLAPDHLLVILESADGESRELIRSAVRQGVDVVTIGAGSGDSFRGDVLALGSRGYLEYPVDGERLWQVLGDGRTRVAPVVTSETIASVELGGLLLGGSPTMHRIGEEIARVAPTAASVLITGESGTGKEMVAQAIHRLSRRREHSFVPVNCGAIPHQLLESEFFGHEKGSFTGAVRDHRGYFERADGGTLFLDEITEMPVELQVKLLRVLETRSFARVGSSREQKTDFRLIAATNRDPQRAVSEGYLRGDLLYRIQVFPLHLPPLREREDDVELLMKHFLKEYNALEGTRKRFSAGALEAMRGHDWPGNLRELKNVVYRAYILADELIEAADLPVEVTAPPDRATGPSLTLQVGTSVAEAERHLIMATLEHCRGRRYRAARMLGVSVKTLYNRLREYREAGGDQVP